MNNPPAFPRPSSSEGSIRHFDGMTLRDYFAAAAITGLLSNPHAVTRGTREALIHISTFKRTAWEIADEMLKARQEQT